MFTRQKRNYRNFVYAALVVALCALVVALFWPKEQETIEENPRNATVEVNKDTGTSSEENSIDHGNTKNSLTDEQGDNLTDADGNTLSDKDGNISEEDEEEKPVVENSFKTYYLVKKDGDSIKVFFSNGSGELIELEETQILYELLPAEDQSKFDSGIKVSSQEELSLLLQDFES